MNELDNLLDDLNSVKISRPEVQQLSNGSSRDLREESPLVDTKSAGQVSELVANLESDLRHSSGSLQKWKQGKEIKPITTETFVEEKNTTIECKPQPIISSPLKAVQTSPRPVKRDPDLENLVNSIPEAPKSSLRYRVEPIAKGTCCVCKKPIHGQLVTALGKCWHLECFTCLHCGIELGKENFFEKDGKPYCENDFHMLFSPKCGYCSEPIIDVSCSNERTTFVLILFNCLHRNVCLRWARLGIPNTSSVASVEQLLETKDIMKWMAKHIVGSTTLTCLLPSVQDVRIL
jgi:hypothetical protein